jgi:hypothetical protein
MVTLSLLGIFTRDIVKISAFYRDVFSSKESATLSTSKLRVNLLPLVSE